jgi:hypothetical protein
MGMTRQSKQRKASHMPSSIGLGMPESGSIICPRTKERNREYKEEME